jgi:hypothetical protein
LALIGVQEIERKKRLSSETDPVTDLAKMTAVSDPALIAGGMIDAVAACYAVIQTTRLCDIIIFGPCLLFQKSSTLDLGYRVLPEDNTAC